MIKMKKEYSIVYYFLFFEKKVIRFELFLKILMEHFPKQFQKCLDRFLEPFTIYSEIPFGLLMTNVMSKNKKKRK